MDIVKRILSTLFINPAILVRRIVLVAKCPNGVRIGGGVIVSNISGIDIAEGAKIDRNATLDASGESGSLSVGAYSVIHEGCILRAFGGSIKIGDECSFNPYTAIYGGGDVTIGSHVRVAIHGTIVASNHRFDDRNELIMKQGLEPKDIIIEDDVWIGANVVILGGVTIGKGAIVAAGAVVTKSILPYHTVAGVPAKTIAIRGAEAVEA